MVLTLREHTVIAFRGLRGDTEFQEVKFGWAPKELKEKEVKTFQEGEGSTQRWRQAMEQ